MRKTRNIFGNVDYATICTFFPKNLAVQDMFLTSLPICTQILVL